MHRAARQRDQIVPMPAREWASARRADAQSAGVIGRLAPSMLRTEKTTAFASRTGVFATIDCR